MYELKPNETVSFIFPICVEYTCEHCNKGKMKAGKINTEEMYNALGSGMPYMYPHVCIECSGELLLPKQYPFIEWVPLDGSSLRRVFESDDWGDIEIITKLIRLYDPMCRLFNPLKRYENELFKNNIVLEKLSQMECTIQEKE